MGHTGQASLPGGSLRCPKLVLGWEGGEEPPPRNLALLRLLRASPWHFTERQWPEEERVRALSQKAGCLWV